MLSVIIEVVLRLNYLSTMVKHRSIYTVLNYSLHILNTHKQTQMFYFARYRECFEEISLRISFSIEKEIVKINIQIQNGFWLTL